MDLTAFTELVRSCVALRLRLPLQPAGGLESKVYPPTYSGGIYAAESRLVEQKTLPCVLLDSTAAQANRMELALKVAWQRGEIKMPVVYSDFEPYFDPDVSDGSRLSRPVGCVTTLDAPHRISDAILRDSIVPEEELVFRTPRIKYESSWGQRLRKAGIRNARLLYEICPTALLFGMWDATFGTLGLRIERAISSEIVGMDVVYGTRTASRIDPLGIERDALVVYRADDTHPLPWTVLPERAMKVDGKPVLYGKEGHPSEINHGNILPVAERGGENMGGGGVTMRSAMMTTVLSLTALRRFSFPSAMDKPAPAAVDLAGQTVLAALGVTAVSLVLRTGLDLRSRCVLHPAGEILWEALSPFGEVTPAPDLHPEKTSRLLAEAVEAARAEELHWLATPLRLVPTDDLVRLLAASQRVVPAGAATPTGGANGVNTDMATVKKGAGRGRRKKADESDVVVKGDDTRGTTLTVESVEN